MKTENTYQTLIFYTYRTIEFPEILMERERAVWGVLGLRGRMIIAEEGINGTLEGTVENTEIYIKHIQSDKRFKYMKIKKSPSGGDTFPRISIKIREEIVGTHFPKHIDPRVKTAEHITAKQLHKKFEKNENFVIVDMRNSYEIESGRFQGSIDPRMEASRELPEKIEYIKAEAAGRPIVTVCTAGVRCEKMSALLLDSGIENVYQLEDGIHGYIQAYPQGYFEGTLFTFDDRLTMDFTKDREIIGVCKRCPNKSEDYFNCATCHELCIICDSCAVSDNTAYCSSDCEVVAVAK
ncbi:MAG: hypothetical protein RI996_302 [Candidatus Parcubacteria bacterium]|jgi:UPF0176 protein